MSDLNIRNNLHVGIEFDTQGSNLVATVTPQTVGAAPVVHEHEIADVDGLANILANKMDASTNFDGRYLRVDANESLASPFQAFGRGNLGLGTSAVLDVPSAGDAGPTQVVLGSDSRLTGGGGGGSGTHEINLGNISGTATIDLDENKVVNAYGTLTGNTTLAFSNIASGGVTVVTLALTQDGTGSRTVAFPVGTVLLNGGDGSINPTAGATTWLTFVRVGSTWSVGISDARPNKFDPLYWSIPDNGSYYIVVGPDPITLNLPGTVTEGTGSVAHARSTNGGSSFSTVTSSTTFNPGDVYRLTVSGFSGWLAVTVPRTA